LALVADHAIQLFQLFTRDGTALDEANSVN